jgi:anti-sigma-K factor RskA
MNTNSSERDVLAAEYALGLLTDDDLRQARELFESDPEFRSAVARWSGRLAPMLDEIDEAAPPPGLWQSIESRLPASRSPSNVIILQRRVSRWRAASAAMTALAASLAIILVARPGPRPLQPPSPVPTAPMVAMLGDSGAAKLVATWTPDKSMLVVAASAAMPLDRSHSHELWVIPEGGKPRSLGTMPAGRHMMMHVPRTLSGMFRTGATLAVSLEPAGGSPTGLPTGPVLAAGQLETA